MKMRIGNNLFSVITVVLSMGFIPLPSNFTYLIRRFKVISGPRFNIKMSSYQYRKSHCGDKTVVRSSYLHNGNSDTGMATSVYWIRAQIASLVRERRNFIGKALELGLSCTNPSRYGATGHEITLGHSQHTPTCLRHHNGCRWCDSRHWLPSIILRPASNRMGRMCQRHGSNWIPILLFSSKTHYLINSFHILSHMQ